MDNQRWDGTTPDHRTRLNTQNNTGQKCIQKQALWIMGHYLYTNTVHQTTPNNTRKHYNSMWWEVHIGPSSKDNGSGSQLHPPWSHWGNLKFPEGTLDLTKIWTHQGSPGQRPTNGTHMVSKYEYWNGWRGKIGNSSRIPRSNTIQVTGRRVVLLHKQRKNHETSGNKIWHHINSIIIQRHW